MKNNEIEDELEGISPFLSNLQKNKKEGLSMPKNYFDTFEDRLMHRIVEEEALEGVKALKSETSTLSENNFWAFLRTIIQPYYAIGFSTTMVLIVFGLYFVNQNGDGSSLSDNDIDGLLAEVSIDNYIYNNIEDFTTEEIMTVLAVDEIREIQEDITPLDEPSTTDVESTTKESSMDKALKAVEENDLLDDITEEDLEIDENDLF